MTLYGYDELPEGIREQIERVTTGLRVALEGNLIALYLHGSIGQAAFDPTNGDIDLLGVVEGPIDRSKRLALARLFLALQKKPCPLEISIVKKEDLGKNPPLDQFHFSDYWEKAYAELVVDTEKPHFLLDMDFEDADVLCYRRGCLTYGVTLFGPEPKYLVPDVTDAEFWQSIADGAGENPPEQYGDRYIPSEILILCRVLCVAMNGRMIAKPAVADWARENLPEAYLPLVLACSAAWFEKAPLKLEDYPVADFYRWARSVVVATDEKYASMPKP